MLEVYKGKLQADNLKRVLDVKDMQIQETKEKRGIIIYEEIYTEFWPTEYEVYNTTKRTRKWNEWRVEFKRDVVPRFANFNGRIDYTTRKCNLYVEINKFKGREPSEDKLYRVAVSWVERVHYEVARMLRGARPTAIIIDDPIPDTYIGIDLGIGKDKTVAVKATRNKDGFITYSGL